MLPSERHRECALDLSPVDQRSQLALSCSIEEFAKEQLVANAPCKLCIYQVEKFESDKGFVSCLGLIKKSLAAWLEEPQRARASSIRTPRSSFMWLQREVTKSRKQEHYPRRICTMLHLMHIERWRPRKAKWKGGIQRGESIATQPVAMVAYSRFTFNSKAPRMIEFSERKASSKGEKLAQRLSGILALLHQGEHLDKHLLADRFQVDVRTIERDLSERLDGIVERNAQGRWQLMHAARGAIPARHLNEYARLSGTQNLFPDSSLSYLLQQLDKTGNRRTMQVQPAATEDLVATALYFARLEAAIDQCFECRFEYKGKVRRVQPYRLIHKHGIWYLAATEGERLKNFSVALVMGLEVDDGCRFSPKPEHHDYIDGKDDVWFAPDTVEVVLRVAPVAAHYFTRRALLPKQRHCVDAGGALTVVSQISHPQQLLPVVRYWLPHVRIVQPKQWHENLISELKQALELWDAS